MTFEEAKTAVAKLMVDEHPGAANTRADTMWRSSAAAIEKGACPGTNPLDNLVLALDFGYQVGKLEAQERIEELEGIVQEAGGRVENLENMALEEDGL